MNEHDLMQQVLDEVLEKSEILVQHDLTRAIYLLCDWAAKYHLTQLKASKPMAIEPTFIDQTYLAIVAALDLTLNGLLETQRNAFFAGVQS